MMPKTSCSCSAVSDTSEFDPETAWRYYLSGLQNYLDSRIVGQSVATAKIARAIQASEFGLNETGNRPKCSFLFLGPTGVGKTESAKCFAEYLWGEKTALEMIFMNEYSSDARLKEFLDMTDAAIRRRNIEAVLLLTRSLGSWRMPRAQPMAIAPKNSQFV